jgi:hypothetical protein
MTRSPRRWKRRDLPKLPPNKRRLEFLGRLHFLSKSELFLIRFVRLGAESIVRPLEVEVAAHSRFRAVMEQNPRVAEHGTVGIHTTKLSSRT